ncbi:MAG: porin family protein [Candidatus Binatia bacterium]
MISRKLSIVTAAALLVAASTTARAQDVVVEETTVAETTAVAPAESGPYGGTAPYFSAGGVYAIENVGGLAGSLSNSGGYDIRAGYTVHENVAVELEWQSLVNLSRDAQDPITGNDEPSLEARMLSLNGRFKPLTGRIQPYGLIGMGWVNVQADKVANHTHKSSFGMRFGLGVAAYITERTGVALEAAYILPLTGTLGGGQSFDLVPITLSVFFRFK